ncbi:MAG: DUF4388 domain-containing protein, partial [Bdellovibrionales bacterium]|nr:DUF4388 domain-containing protein [Bdellovibrionales bacterium]
MTTKTKKVLFYSECTLEDFTKIETELLKQQFIVSRVSSLDKFIESSRYELQHIHMVALKNADDYTRFSKTATQHFSSQLSPRVLLGPSSDMFASDSKSILNQIFTFGTDPSLIAEFCSETFDLFFKESRYFQISHFNIPEVIASLSLITFTGEIVFENQTERCIVYFSDGKIACASSSREDKKFGQLLLQHGIVSEMQVEKVMAMLRNDKKKIGQAFVDIGLITNKKLLEMLALQVKHIVIPLFNWEQGSAEVIFESPNSSTIFPFKFEPFQLATEGVKLRFSEAELQKRIQGESSVIKYLRMPAAAFLDSKQQKIVDAIRGKTQTVRDLMVSGKFSKLDCLRSLYILSIFGIVDFIEDTGDSANLRVKEKAIEELFSDPTMIEQTENESYRRPLLLLLMLTVLGAISFSYQYFDHAIFRDMSAYDSVSRNRTSPRHFPKPAAATEQKKQLVPSNSSVAQHKVSTNILAKSNQNTSKAAIVESVRHLRTSSAPYDKIAELLGQANLALTNRDYERAEYLSQQVLKINPQHEDGLSILGQVYIEQDRKAEARGVFLKLLVKNPKNGMAHLNLGTLYVLSDQNRQAMVHFRKFLDISKAGSSN